MPEPKAVVVQDRLRELEPLLDQELSRLPDKYRIAIILCDLEGKTRKEVALQLKIPEGTLSSRLTTAKALLAKRFARHGLAMSAGALSTLIPQTAASASVPVTLVSSTIKAVTLVAGGKAAASGVISANVAALTEGVLKAMLFTNLKIAAALVLGAAVVLSSITGLLLSLSSAGQTAPQDKKTIPSRPNDFIANPGYFIFPVKTALQRELLPISANVYVLLDTTNALKDDQIILDELMLKDLKKDLLVQKKGDAKLHFCLFYETGKEKGKNTVGLLHYAFIGFGHEIGFSKVTADQQVYNIPITWGERTAAIAGKERPPEGDEPVSANNFVKAYPVRTGLSRCLTGDADCMVVILAPFTIEKEGIPQKVREATADLIEKLKLPRKKQITFVVMRNRFEADMRSRLFDELGKFAQALGFETSTTMTR